MSLNLRALVPATVKHRIRSAQRSYTLKRCIAQLRPQVEPSDDLLRRLIWAWGNEGFSGDVSYLRAVCREAMQTAGPILECGSGLSTLLLAVYAGKRGVSVLSLEQMPEWQAAISSALQRLGLMSQVVMTPLKRYDGFDWYDIPQNLPKNVKLVICDGPPGETFGGRSGLLPVCRKLLADDCMILLDDAERVEEQKIIGSWAKQHGVEVLPNQIPSRRYATLRLKSL